MPETAACESTFRPIRAGMDPDKIDVGPQLKTPVSSVKPMLKPMPHVLVTWRRVKEIALRNTTIKHPKKS